MNPTLSDEILSINAIYTAETFLPSKSSPDVFILSIPGCDISLRLQFPQDYPENEPPTILGPESSGTETRKGEANEVVSLARDILRDCFYVGEPCVFTLLEEIIPKLQEKHEAEASEHDQHHQHDIETTHDGLPPDTPDAQPKILSVEPNWILSEVLTEKKSIFIARAAHTKTVDEARSYIEHLVTTDKKVAKATHNISAWRIHDTRTDSSLTYQDCDDDGESAAGGRLLHLLQLMDVWNVVVVVSR